MANNTYVQILINILIKKNNLLDELINSSLLQEEYIALEKPDMNKFESTILEKESLIQQMNELDDGFEKVYDHVKDELNESKVQLKEDIIKLQNLIKDVTDKSMRLQAIEKSNNEKMIAFFSSKKKEIKNFKFSSNTVSNYYKSMTTHHQGQSYFLDKKK